MKDHVVTTTHRGIEALANGYAGLLCRRHLAILQAASVKPSPTIYSVCQTVRRVRETALTSKSLAVDFDELQRKHLITIHQ